MPERVRPAGIPRRGTALGRCYGRSAAEHPLLSREEEIELSRRIEDGDRAALRTLVEANLRLVMFIARDYRDRGFDLEDLIQEGNLGLLRAAERFDYRRGVRFSTYAGTWIRASIGAAMDTKQRPVQLPVKLEVLLRRQRSNLREELLRDPTPRELAESLAQAGVKPSVIPRMLDASEPVLSMDRRLGEDGGCALGDLVADADATDPVDVLAQEQLRNLLEEVLGSLPERERRVLDARFDLDDACRETLATLGAEFGMSRQGIHQIERRALRSLRALLLERGVEVSDFVAA